MIQAQTEQELGLCFASFLFFTFSGVGGFWVLKLKLMLTQPPTELELELGLSLAICIFSVVVLLSQDIRLYLTKLLLTERSEVVRVGIGSPKIIA